jgi:hypothetical protein
MQDEEIEQLRKDVSELRELVSQLVSEQGRMVTAVEQEQQKVRELHTLAIRLLSETRRLTSLLERNGIELGAQVDLESIVKELG